MRHRARGTWPPAFSLGVAAFVFLALRRLGPLPLVLPPVLLPGFDLDRCGLHPWLWFPGLGRRLLAVLLGRLCLGSLGGGCCPAGCGGFSGLSPAVGLLQGEAVDKYLSFRRAHPRVCGFAVRSLHYFI